MDYVTGNSQEKRSKEGKGRPRDREQFLDGPSLGRGLSRVHFLNRKKNPKREKTKKYDEIMSVLGRLML